MNFFSVLSLIAFFVYFNIGIYSYRMYRNSKIRGLFLFFCITMAIWSFAYSFVYTSEVNNGGWMKLSAIGWCMYSALILHMSLKLTNSKLIKKWAVRSGIYIPAILFLLMDVFLFWPHKAPGKLLEQFFYTGDFLYNFIYGLTAIVVFLNWGIRDENTTKQKQSRIIVITSIIPFGLTLFAQTVLPNFGLVRMPSLGQIYMLITMLGIYYASTQYSLFDIPYKQILDEILPDMMDMYILLSPDGTITNINKRTELLLGYQRNELIDKKIAEIIDNKQEIVELLSINKESRRSAEMKVIRRDGSTISIQFIFSMVMSKNKRTVLGIVVIGQDITIQKKLEQEIKIQQQTEQRLRESEECFRVIFTKHSSIMMLIDPDTFKIFSVNEAAQKYYGYNEEEFSRLQITDLNGMNAEEESTVMVNILGKDENILILKHRLSAGEWRDVEEHASPIVFTNKKLVFSIIHDVTERKKEEERIIHLAYHDGLTDLFNHKFFYERLREETSRANRYDSKFGVMYIDMDKFKEINDTYGHDYGDLVLKEIAKRILACTRKNDIAARIGGDEFALLLLNIKSSRDVEMVVDKLQKAMESPVIAGNKKLSIRASIGSSIFPDDGSNADYLIKLADKAMYDMKNKRNE